MEEEAERLSRVERRGDRRLQEDARMCKRSAEGVRSLVVSDGVKSESVTGRYCLCVSYPVSLSLTAICCAVC